MTEKIISVRCADTGYFVQILIVFTWLTVLFITLYNRVSIISTFCRYSMEGFLPKYILFLYPLYGKLYHTEKTPRLSRIRTTGEEDIFPDFMIKD